MFIVIYTIVWLVSALGLFLFGFLAGRFGRKLPIIDNALPWTLHQGAPAVWPNGGGHRR